MQKAYNQAGLTSTIDRSQGPEGFRAYQELRARNELTVRSAVTYLMSGQGTPDSVRQDVERIPFVTGFGDEWLRVGPLKVVVDGGILIGTAYLREPYGDHTEIYGYDDRTYRGVLSIPRENLIEIARTANRLGWQMTAHTTGGGATDLLLDAYEAAEPRRADRARAASRSPTATFRMPARSSGRAAGRGVRLTARLAAFRRRRDQERLRAGAHARFPAAEIADGARRGRRRRFRSHDPVRFARPPINPFHPFFGMWMAITRKTAGRQRARAR